MSEDQTSCNSCGTPMKIQGADGFCANCGAGLPAKSTSCLQCGHVPTKFNNSSSQTVKWVVVAVVAVAVVIGAIIIVGTIVTYSVFVDLDQSQGGTTPGGPPGAGPLGAAHTHTAVLVKIFGDKFDFSSPAYQLKSSWIHFEGSDGSTIHKHTTGVTLGYLFETLGIEIDENCFAFTDRRFCSDDQYSLAYYINERQINDIRDYEPREGDRVFISYGAETSEALQSDLLELKNQPIVK